MSWSNVTLDSRGSTWSTFSVDPSCSEVVIRYTTLLVTIHYGIYYNKETMSPCVCARVSWLDRFTCLYDGDVAPLVVICRTNVSPFFGSEDVESGTKSRIVSTTENCSSINKSTVLATATETNNSSSSNIQVNSKKNPIHLPVLGSLSRKLVLDPGILLSPKSTNSNG